MKKTGHCPKCNSTDVEVNARVLERGPAGLQRDLEAGTYKNPDALLLQGKSTFTISACICKSCGFTELYSSKK
jgi:predicted nucleic-acid-binding Zn-ribbon protein